MVLINFRKQRTQYMITVVALGKDNVEIITKALCACRNIKCCHLIQSRGRPALSVEFSTIALVSLKLCRALTHFLHPHLHHKHQLEKHAFPL